MTPDAPDPGILALIERLADIPGSERLYNPYYPPGDAGAEARRANFVRYLSALKQFEPKLLMVAEAPGYRGCRFSGIPVTSERIMLGGIEKWGLFGDGYQATSDNEQGVAEMTATILWGALEKHLERPPVLWNTVPLHPHREGKPMTNRTPTVAEMRMGAVYVHEVRALFDFTVIAAVGRTAERMLGELRLDCVPLRHPSQGGKADFVEGLRNLSAQNL